MNQELNFALGRDYQPIRLDQVDLIIKHGRSRAYEADTGERMLCRVNLGTGWETPCWPCRNLSHCHLHWKSLKVSEQGRNMVRWA
jgi:hypothetical protein